MAEIDRKTLSTDGVRKAVDADVTKIAEAGTSGCAMLSVVQSMTRQDVIEVFKAAQIKENGRPGVDDTLAHIEFSAYPYQPNSGPLEEGAYIDLRMGPDSDAKVNLMFYDTGRKTGGCTNVKVSGDDLIVVK